MNRDTHNIFEEYREIAPGVWRDVEDIATEPVVNEHQFCIACFVVSIGAGGAVWCNSTKQIKTCPSVKDALIDAVKLVKGVTPRTGNNEARLFREADLNHAYCKILAPDGNDGSDKNSLHIFIFPAEYLEGRGHRSDRPSNSATQNKMIEAAHKWQQGTDTSENSLAAFRSFRAYIFDHYVVEPTTVDKIIARDFWYLHP